MHAGFPNIPASAVHKNAATNSNCLSSRRRSFKIHLFLKQVGKVVIVYTQIHEITIKIMICSELYSNIFETLA